MGLDIKGHIVKRVMIAEGASIAKEFYFSVLLDRSNRTFLSLCSVEGGMDIEQLAVERPEALAKIAVDAVRGIDKAKALEIAKAGGFDDELALVGLRGHDEALAGLALSGSGDDGEILDLSGITADH